MFHPLPFVWVVLLPIHVDVSLKQIKENGCAQRVQSPTFWLLLTFPALCSPREHSEQLSNTEKGLNIPQHRGRLPRNICTAVNNSLEMEVLPDTCRPQ